MINFKNNTILGDKAPLIGAIFAGVIIAICLLGIAIPQASNADFANTKDAAYVAKATNEAQKAIKKIQVVVTAYASVPEETDDTPFITASGKTVKDGIIANNMLPFGTKVRIPALYGNKIFTVEDRMNQRKGYYHVDIWFPEYEQAKDFGAKISDIEILGN